MDARCRPLRGLGARVTAAGAVLSQAALPVDVQGAPTAPGARRAASDPGPDVAVPAAGVAVVGCRMGGIRSPGVRGTGGIRRLAPLRHRRPISPGAAADRGHRGPGRGPGRSIIVVRASSVRRLPTVVAMRSVRVT
jgi:hypothetical protein